MALDVTVGGASAEAYASVAEFDAYLLARGITNTFSTTQKENALRIGASYLENQYRRLWRGITVTSTQSLAWPRVDGSRDYYRGFTQYLLDQNGWYILDTIVPVQVKNANIEAARLSLAGVSLEPTLERGGQIKSIGKSVGPLRKDITYADGASIVDRYLVIEGLLKGLVTGSPGSTSGNVSLVRS